MDFPLGAKLDPEQAAAAAASVARVLGLLSGSTSGLELRRPGRRVVKAGLVYYGESTQDSGPSIGIHGVHLRRKTGGTGSLCRPHSKKKNAGVASSTQPPLAPYLGHFIG